MRVIIAEVVQSVPSFLIIALLAGFIGQTFVKLSSAAKELAHSDPEQAQSPSD